MYSELMVLAASETVLAASDPITGSFLQYGAIGAGLVVLGWFARSLIRREQERSDRLETEVSRLNIQIQDKTIPALLMATQAIQASQAILQSIQRQREIEAEAARYREGRQDG